MKFIMYHYVRPPCPDMPYFKYLDLDDFRQQLDYFATEYGFVTRDEFRRFSTVRRSWPGRCLIVR